MVMESLYVHQHTRATRDSGRRAESESHCLLARREGFHVVNVDPSGGAGRSRGEVWRREEFMRSSTRQEFESVVAGDASPIAVQ